MEKQTCFFYILILFSSFSIIGCSIYETKVVAKNIDCSDRQFFAEQFDNIFSQEEKNMIHKSDVSNVSKGVMEKVISLCSLNNPDRRISQSINSEEVQSIYAMASKIIKNYKEHLRRATGSPVDVHIDDRIQTVTPRVQSILDWLSDKEKGKGPDILKIPTET